MVLTEQETEIMRSKPWIEEPPMAETKIDHWQSLMDRAYDKWQTTDGTPKGWNYRQFLLNLDAVERKAVILGNFHYQVCNGGLQQWVDNGYASSAGPDLLTLLDEIGTETAKKVSEIVKKVLVHVDLSVEKGETYDYWLEEWIDEEEPDYILEVQALDSPYYDLSDVFTAEVEKYLVELTG